MSSIVGLIGAGNMGRGMAASLARAGCRVLQFDVNRELLASSTAQSPSIESASSIADVAERASDGGVIVSVAGE